MSTRKAVFWTFAFFLFVLIVPQLCAQNKVSMSPEQAAITRQKLIDYSKEFLGKPYASGGIGPNSFDCSGFVFTVSRESIGVQLPRTTRAIYNFCKEIDGETREAGDLVFFKTTSSGEVSHVGIYLGNSKFIHAASDGPNTGVIISSLKESYWKAHYFCTRRYLPASKSELLSDSDPETYEERVVEKSNSGDSVSPGNSKSSLEAKYSGPASSSRKKFVRSDGDSFLESLVIDGSLSFDWSFFTPDSFRVNFRGIDTMIHARYAGKTLQPGAGTYIRYDAGTGNVQLPLVVSLTLNEYFRFFAGAVFPLGKPHLSGNSDKRIKNLIFPGIIGVCFSTPGIQIKKTFVSLVQDIHYTFFNDSDGSALSFTKSVGTGLVLATGIRVTLPLNSVL